MRFAAATALALVFTAVAAWVVVAGPANDVDDVAVYHAAASPRGDPVTVTVDAGAATDEIADSLKSSGAIGSAAQFRVLVALLGYDRLLQPGEYEFARETPDTPIQGLVCGSIHDAVTTKCNGLGPTRFWR